MSVLRAREQLLRWLCRPTVVGARRVDQALEALWPRAEPTPPLPLLPSGLAERCRPYQRLTRIRPLIRVRLLLVVVLQVGPQTLCELLHRAKVAAFEELPRQHAEEQLDLIEPRAMFGHVM